MGCQIQPKGPAPYTEAATLLKTTPWIEGQLWDNFGSQELETAGSHDGGAWVTDTSEESPSSRNAWIE